RLPRADAGLQRPPQGQPLRADHGRPDGPAGPYLPSPRPHPPTAQRGPATMSAGPGELQRSPLDAVHRRLGAKMGAFAGWDMPIQYQGTMSEHQAVRERVGVFDLSHLGKVEVR